MNWYKKANSNILNIILTPAEKEWADWAIDPMYDHWCTKEGAWDREGEILEENIIPIVQNNNLLIPNNSEIIEDLLYRLEQQAYDVCETDSSSEQQKIARYRSAKNLANKIRNII